MNHFNETAEEMLSQNIALRKLKKKKKKKVK